jgi:hypothetical protein
MENFPATAVVHHGKKDQSAGPALVAPSIRLSGDDRKC